MLFRSASAVLFFARLSSVDVFDSVVTEVAAGTEALWALRQNIEQNCIDENKIAFLQLFKSGLFMCKMQFIYLKKFFTL